MVTSCNNSLPNAPNIVAEVACGGNIRLGNGSVTLERLDLNSGSLTVDGATLDIAGLNNSDYGSQRTMRFVLDSGEVRVSSLDWTDGAEFHLNGGTLTLKTVQSESYVGPGSVVIRNGSSFYQKSGVVTGENIGLYDPYSAGVIQIINAKGSDNTKFDALSGSYTLENGEIRNISLMVFGEFRVLNPQVELFLKSLHFDSIYRVPLLRWF